MRRCLSSLLVLTLESEFFLAVGAGVAAAAVSSRKVWEAADEVLGVVSSSQLALVDDADETMEDERSWLS